MKLTVKQLKQLIREQVEEMGVPENFDPSFMKRGKSERNYVKKSLKKEYPNLCRIVGEDVLDEISDNDLSGAKLGLLNALEEHEDQIAL